MSDHHHHHQQHPQQHLQPPSHNYLSVPQPNVSPVFSQASLSPLIGSGFFPSSPVFPNPQGFAQQPQYPVASPAPPPQVYPQQQPYPQSYAPPPQQYPQPHPVAYPQQQQQQQPLPDPIARSKSPYRHVVDRKVRFDLPNARDFSSAIPQTPQISATPIPGAPQQYYYPPTAAAQHAPPSPNFAPVSPQPNYAAPVPTGTVPPTAYSSWILEFPTSVDYFNNPQEYYRKLLQVQKIQQLQEQLAVNKHIYDLVQQPAVSTKENVKKHQPPQPFFRDYHFNSDAFKGYSSDIRRSQMYYVQTVTFQAAPAHTGSSARAKPPVREFILLRPMKNNQTPSSTGILLQFVAQGTGPNSRLALETQPDFDPKASRDYCGYRNIGVIKNVEYFLDIACFLPVPLENGGIDPSTGTIPVASFRAWSSILFMEAVRRNVLLLNSSLGK